MSIDSLDVIPFEEDWPDEEEEKLYTGVTRVRSGEELQRNQPTHVERENDLQTEEEEQLSKTPDGNMFPLHILSDSWRKDIKPENCSTRQ